MWIDVESTSRDIRVVVKLDSSSDGSRSSSDGSSSGSSCFPEWRSRRECNWRGMHTM